MRKDLRKGDGCARICLQCAPRRAAHLMKWLRHPPLGRHQRQRRHRQPQSDNSCPSAAFSTAHLESWRRLRVHRPLQQRSCTPPWQAHRHRFYKKGPTTQSSISRARHQGRLRVSISKGKTSSICQVYDAPILPHAVGEIKAKGSRNLGKQLSSSCCNTSLPSPAAMASRQGSKWTPEAPVTRHCSPAADVMPLALPKWPQQSHAGV